MQVDQKNESILVPIYGLMVPFHILAVKNAVNSQEGDHSYIRINFNFGPAYEPGAKFPHLVFLKELSYRTSDNRHAAKVGSHSLESTMKVQKLWAPKCLSKRELQLYFLTELENALASASCHSVIGIVSICWPVTPTRAFVQVSTA